jgi:hypothetical protein
MREEVTRIGSQTVSRTLFTKGGEEEIVLPFEKFLVPLKKERREERRGGNIRRN